MTQCGVIMVMVSPQANGNSYREFNTGVATRRYTLVLGFYFFYVAVLMGAKELTCGSGNYQIRCKQGGKGVDELSRSISTKLFYQNISICRSSSAGYN